jgi:hypothetical protein
VKRNINALIMQLASYGGANAPRCARDQCTFSLQRVYFFD